MPTLLTIPILLALAFLALFVFAELLHRRLKVRAEITRKIVHAGTGLLTLLFPLVLENVWQVAFLCGSFLILLLASLRFGWLPSINDIDRVSHGSILYPVAVFICYVVFAEMNHRLVFFYLPILILAICDPLAALIGKRFSFGKYRIGKASKTWAGSAAFLASALLIAFLSLDFLEKNTAGTLRSFSGTMIIASVATASEAISSSGMDNLFIPVSVVITLMCLL